MIELRRNPPKKKVLKVYPEIKKFASSKKIKESESSKAIFDKVCRGSSVLDIGAGDKSLKEFIIRDELQGIYKSMDIDRTFKHDFYSLDEITGTYDCVLCFNLFEHLELEITLKYLEKVYDILKEGGKLIISVPNIDHINHMWKHDITHIRQYPAKDLYAILKLMNFKGEINIYRLYHRPYRHTIKSKILEILKIVITRILEVDYCRDILIIAEK